MGLASQAGNQVTLSYRQDRFSRIKERNSQRIAEFVRARKLNLLFNSRPLEFKPESVLLEVQGAAQEIANDYAWIFAGGTPPNDFLKQIGVAFGARDLTLEAGNEARQTASSRA